MVEIAQTHARVLVLDSNLERARELSHRLRFLNYEPVVADNPDSGKDVSHDPGIAVMLGDVGETELRETFHNVMRQRPEIPVLLFDANPDDAELSQAMTDHPLWKLDAPIRRHQLAKLLRRAEHFDEPGSADGNKLPAIRRPFGRSVD